MDLTDAVNSCLGKKKSAQDKTREGTSTSMGRGEILELKGTIPISRSAWAEVKRVRKKRGNQ